MQVEETALPGIGVRQDLVTTSGRRVGVVSYRTGRRELVLYDTEDPDAGSEVIPLTDGEADALAEVLGAPRVVERLATLQEQAAGLVTEQVPITPGSPYDGRPLGDTRARTRTGASIVAVLREGGVMASPGPSFEFTAGDTVVVVGTRDGAAGVAEILARG
ncbi:MAG: potassium transporter TrkA [Streptosporangiales bacterium]|nr:potassium transporter TrkA [Streptosporangiales bacterium]